MTDSAFFDLALSLGEDVAQVYEPSPSEDGRAGVSQRPGAVSDDVPAVRARDDGRAGGAAGAATFSLPVPVGAPRFGGDDPPTPGHPGPPPTPPFPPPPLGVGPLYDALPTP